MPTDRRQYNVFSEPGIMMLAEEWPALEANIKYILAIVQVENGFAQAPRYVRGPLDHREPRFDQSAIKYNLKRIMERAGVPK